MPGSGLVKEQAEKEGLTGSSSRPASNGASGLFHVPGDEPGPAGERRTLRLDSNRNFEGRQAPAAVPTWSARRWPPPRPSTAASSMSANCSPEENRDETLYPDDRSRRSAGSRQRRYRSDHSQATSSIKRTGFGPNLFDEWRYLDVGQPGQDNSKRPLNRTLVLNQPYYRALKRTAGAGELRLRLVSSTRPGRWTSTVSAR